MEYGELFIEKAFIGGKWLDAKDGGKLEVLNPASGEVMASVPNMGKAETLEAITVADEVFGRWKATTSKERYTFLMRWHQLIVEHIETLAELVIGEQGKPLTEAKAEVAYAANFVQWFAEQAKRIHGTVVDRVALDSHLQYTKQPVGVVGIITPWNFPLAMITRKVAPALAAGCTVVIKPSEYTPCSALALMKLAEQAGIPAGVCNMITTDKASEVGKVMTDSKAVRKMSFTGSTRVGKILLAAAAGTVKRMSMELGGNAPFIVFDDADLEVSVAAVLASKFRNSGQTCVCANRILVQEGIHDKFVEVFKKKVGELVVGEGNIQGVSQGPLINQQAVEKVESHIKHALELGAKVELGGKICVAKLGNNQKNGGTFFEPTILTGVPRESRFNSEETFGPVAPIIKFKTEAEAIAIANQTDYGLAAYFCSSSLARVHRVLNQLESGMVSVNGGNLSNEFGPFGGVKESGLGREGSELGIEEYLETKYSVIRYDY